MNEKFTLQELAELIAQRHQMELDDANAFVKAFWSLLEEALASDKYVKVKGLGTFKLVESESCKDIDSQEYFRISFTPDTAMRDLVNKPFEYFEAVVLNEHTCLDDMENGDIGSVEEKIMVDDECKVEEEATGDGGMADEDAVALSEMDSNSGDCTSQEKETLLKRWFYFPWCMIASVLLIGVLAGAGIVWGVLSGRQYIPESVVRMILEQDSLDIPIRRNLKQTKKMIYPPIALDSVLTKDRSKSLSPLELESQTEQSESHKELETLADTVKYRIDGTQTTYTLKNGESLVRVALKFYGNKKLWPYLAKYNKDIIRNADNVPVGTTIRIPRLVPRND